MFDPSSLLSVCLIKIAFYFPLFYSCLLEPTILFGLTVYKIKLISKFDIVLHVILVNGLALEDLVHGKEKAYARPEASAPNMISIIKRHLYKTTATILCDL